MKEIEKIKSIKDIKNVFINFLPLFYDTNKYIKILSICFYRLEKNKNIEAYNKFIKVNKDYYKIKFLFKNGLFGLKLGNYKYFLNRNFIL